MRKNDKLFEKINKVIDIKANNRSTGFIENLTSEYMFFMFFLFLISGIIFSNALFTPKVVNQPTKPTKLIDVETIPSSDACNVFPNTNQKMKEKKETRSQSKKRYVVFEINFSPIRILSL